jgi:fluoride exporter
VSAATWIAVAALGSVAAMGRFLLGGWISARSHAHLPLGTLAVNLSGALMLGLVAGLALSGNALVLVGAATIGSYTTFSSWMLETHSLQKEGRTGMAVANVLVSLALGIAAVALGRAIGGGM